MSKKLVLVSSFIYVVYFIGIFVLDSICHSSWCRIQDDDFLGWIFFLFLPFLPIFFFSLLTYRMRDEVFFSWWKFAFWFAPFIAIMTYFLYRKGTSGGNSLTQGIFEAVVLWVLYGIFIFVSLIKIFFAWRRVKKG